MAEMQMRVVTSASRWVDRVELTATQLVLALEMTPRQTTAPDVQTSDSDTTSGQQSPPAVGMTMSVSGVCLETDLCTSDTDLSPSVNLHLRLEDALVKTGVDKSWRTLIGPFSVSVDAGLMVVPVSATAFMPQLLLALDTSLVQVGIVFMSLFLG